MSHDGNNEEEKALHYESGIPIFSPPLKDQDAEQRAECKATRTYEDRQATLQDRMLLTQIALVIFGLVGTGVSIWQAKTAQESADTSDKTVLLAQKANREQSRQSALTLKTTIDQFQLENRAYLSVEPPISPIEEKWSSVTVPIINYGHVSSVIHSVKLRYDRFPGTIADTATTVTALETREVSTNREQVIAPGSAGFKLSFESPKYPTETAKNLTLANEHLRVDGHIFYSTGFGGIDLIRFCLYYQNPQSGWRSCSGSSMSVDAGSGEQEKQRTYVIK